VTRLSVKIASYATDATESLAQCIVVTGPR